MENNNKQLERWMFFLVKNDYIVLAIIMTIFIVYLCMAIFYRIEGLGIFSIVLGIIFILILMYSKNKASNSQVDPGNPGDPGARIKENASHFRDAISEEKYTSFLISCLFNIIGNLTKNIEKLNPEQVKKLMDEIDVFHQKLTNTYKKNQKKPPKDRFQESVH